MSQVMEITSLPPAALRVLSERAHVAGRHWLAERVLHSITSSAWASNEGGIVRPIAFAVLRLIVSRNFVGW